MSIDVRINGKEHRLDVDPEMPLLWVLRDVLGLTGTKYGCGEALCGACAVHLDGRVVRSCVTPIARAAGADVTTIEGLSPDGSHPLQQAWTELGVPQCGFCQAGQIMTAAARAAAREVGGGLIVAAAAIVLAAGEGRRMGGPKALLVVDGQPLIRRHADRLDEVGCDPIVVVVRPAVVDRARAALGDGARVRLVAADTMSQASSLAMGLRSLTLEEDTAVVVTPVDMLPAAPSTIGALLAVACEDGVHVATPRHRGRGGHPVVLRAPLLRTICDGHPLREVIRAARGRRREIDVDDAAVGGDLDTPADLAALRPGAVARFGARC